MFRETVDEAATEQAQELTQQRGVVDMSLVTSESDAQAHELTEQQGAVDMSLVTSGEQPVVC